MSERKVLNKYYPPDFDPSKIPRMKLAKNRQYTVRLMAPFNMRCVTCGEYIYKGKKFNARKEDVENEDYLGIRIYRFYIKCTRCLQEISFKTDPKNTDYEIEAGATRNFMALKLAEEQAKREEDEQKEEEANNPMKLLECRTEQSRQEIELLESLEELKDLNRRQQAVDYDSMLQQYQNETAAERAEREAKEDEEFIKSVKFSKQSGSQRIVTEEIIEEVADDTYVPATKLTKNDQGEPEVKTKEKLKPENVSTKKNALWNRSVGCLVKKTALNCLVKTGAKRNSSQTIGVIASKRNEAKDAKEAALNKVKTVESSKTPVEEAAKKLKDSSNVASSKSSEVTSPKPNGLSMLASYSDSGSDSGE